MGNNKKMQGKLEVKVKIVKFLLLKIIGEGIYSYCEDPFFTYTEKIR